MDVAISVSNVMLWERPAPFAGVTRVFGRGRLVITVQRRVLDVPPAELEAVARAVGLAGARLAALDRRVGERGFASVLAARIAPVAPFMVVSYAAGLSSVRLVPYLFGTAVGLVPWSVLYVGIGASLTAIGSSASLADVIAPLAVVASCAVLVAWLWWRRRHRPHALPHLGWGSTASSRPGLGEDLSTVPPERPDS